VIGRDSLRGEVFQSIAAFSRWLESYGYDSHDPYDIWGTRIGIMARRTYYRSSLVGLPLVGPILLMEILCPRLRALFLKKCRYATADAQLALAFLNLYELTCERAYLEKAEGICRDLISYSVPGYKGYCWGYPFDWQNVNNLTPRNTPFITTTPYCFEAFLKLADLSGETCWLDAAFSVAKFVRFNLKDTPVGNDATAGSYSPYDEGKVVNASAYRAMVLFEAAHRFDIPEYAETAWGNLRFILQSQRDDGAWLYAIDNPGETFIDHFHTCFVLKNLHKLNLRLQNSSVVEAIRRGFDYYRKHLFAADGLPASFALAKRTRLVRWELYDFAEAITLGSLLNAYIPGALDVAESLAKLLCQRFQSPEGHFATRIYKGGFKHTFPYLRWPQAQLFYAMTNFLSVVTAKSVG
jgi:hypothetical protein